MSEDLDIEVSHDVSSFAAELRRLADALESGGEYVIQIDGEDVTIPADADFAVALEREDGDSELEFQITWSSAEDEGESAEDEGDSSEDEEKETLSA
jgi:amphi-Trp domain-containing protein